MRAKPAVVNGYPRSLTKTNGDDGLSRCNRRKASARRPGPLLWKDASDILGDPLHLAAGGGGYEAQHQGVHSAGASLGICQAY
jgi:hypothetical protein